VISYKQKELFIAVKWEKVGIGRIYCEVESFHYRPRGCGGLVRSEEFATLEQMKSHLEGE